MASERATRRGLLVDWGGVLTTNLFAGFNAFCAREGLERDAIAAAFRTDPGAREMVVALETGRLPETEFEQGLASLLGVDGPGLIDRLFAGSALEPAMIEAVAAARVAGIRTGLISNSWGTRRYDRALLARLFDGIVISGEVGMRKPTPEMYTRGAEVIGVPTSQCVFVDDLPFNLPPAEELGMATVHHVTAEQTIAELEDLLGVRLQ
jgi:epoxide hydrolase-like predicted phosphatase